MNAVQEQYPVLSAEEAKKVVPEGIKSGKVMTSGEVPGVSRFVGLETSPS